MGASSFAGPISLNTSVSTFRVDSTSLTLTGTLSGNGGFVKTGIGTLYLTGANLANGPVTLSAGLLSTSSVNGLGSGPVSLGNGTTLQLNVSSAMTLANTVSGAGNILKSGVGTLTVSGINLHSGSVTIAAGTLKVINGGSLGSGTISVAPGSSLVYYLTQDTTIANTITGGGNVLSGNPSYRLTWKGGAVGGPTPTFTSASSASATVYFPFTYQATASNGPNTFSAANLPSGLSINPSTGLISGAIISAGSYLATLTATNAGGSSTFLCVSPALSPRQSSQAIPPPSRFPQEATAS
jgi:autotransporter-associated beta strand protein